MRLLLFTAALFLGSCVQAQDFGNITADRAYELINHPNSTIIILDIRTPDEFASGHIEGAVNLDYYSEDFEADIRKLDTEKTYLIYCRSGGRSGTALELFRKHGVKKTYNMTGGILSWKERGYPLK